MHYTKLISDFYNWQIWHIASILPQSHYLWSHSIICFIVIVIFFFVLENIRPEYNNFFALFLHWSSFSSFSWLYLLLPFFDSPWTFAYAGSLRNQFSAVSVQFHRADIPIHYVPHAARTRFSFARERTRCIHLVAKGAPSDWTGELARVILKGKTL